MSAVAGSVDTVISPNGLFEPYAVAVDRDNNMYITDSSNHRIVKFIPNAGVLTNFAGLIRHPGFQDGVSYLGRFDNPKGIVFVPARGALVVADSGNNLIRQITLDGTVTTLAGHLNPGLADGAGLSARFSFPVGLAVDASGNVYIADTKNDAIRKLDLNNNVSTVAAGFYEPQALAVSDDGLRLFVADTGSQAIWLIETDGVNVLQTTLVAGSDSRMSGFNDSIIGAEALFSSPLGMLWLGDGVDRGVLISDTGNHVVRRIYHNPDLIGIPGAEYSVETFAGVPGQRGYVDGPTTAAKFGSPVGLAKDMNGVGYLVVDLGNNVVRRIQVAAVVLPSIMDPVIGWVDFQKDVFGDRVTLLQPVTQAVFNNEVTVAILAEPGVETYYTSGLTSTNADTIPIPSRGTGSNPPFYQNGLPESQVPASITESMSDLRDITIKVRSIADGRKPSSVIQTRFRFQTANPVIMGNNPASFVLQDQTIGARMYYSTDGSEPTTNSFGPFFNGDTLSIGIGTADIIFKVRAFRDRFAPSSTQQKTFHPGDVVYNAISFGFSDGEASSAFVAAPGQRFYAPVTLSLLPNTKMYTLQFNLTVTNLGAAPPLPATSKVVGFDSMLLRPLEGITPPAYVPIEPAMMAYSLQTDTFPLWTEMVSTNFIATNDYVTTIIPSQILTNTLITNILNYQVFTNVTATNIEYATVNLTTTLVTNLVPNPIFPNTYYTNVSLVSSWITNTLTMLAPSNVVSTNIISTNIYVTQLVTNRVFTSFVITNVATNAVITNFYMTNYTFGLLDAKFTNDIEAHLLGIGWLERGGKTNLYNTTKQDLITYSQAHDAMYLSSGSRVILGAYSFQIPANATLGQNYKIQLGRPSATADGISADVYIDTPTNGSLGAGAINSVKNIVVGRRDYLVGDVTPFRWFNAGDFGNWKLKNNDVVQIFQSAVYGLNTPPAGSDFFDAMDSSNGATNGLYSVYDGNDLSINNMVSGDGALNVDDVFVVFRRSLDPALANVVRFWDPATGLKRWYLTNNSPPLGADLPAEKLTLSAPDLPAEAFSIMNSTDPPSVRFVAQDVQGSPGQTIEVPIQALITGPHPVRVLMFSLNIEPLEGAPELIQPVQFIPAPGLGQPTLNISSGSANYAAAWLNPAVPGVWGANLIGSLVIAIPGNATAPVAYRMEFAHVSASPNGLGLLPQQVQTGLLTLSSRLASSWLDGIPDQWRLRYFGAVSNFLAQANADPDDDGVPNWAEFRAGTDPMNIRSLLRLAAVRMRQATGTQTPAGLAIRWPSVAGKRYVVETSASIKSNRWIPLSATLIGTGLPMEFAEPDADAQAKFYRVRLLD